MLDCSGGHEPFKEGTRRHFSKERSDRIAVTVWSLFRKKRGTSRKLRSDRRTTIIDGRERQSKAKQSKAVEAEHHFSQVCLAFEVRSWDEGIALIRRFYMEDNHREHQEIVVGSTAAAAVTAKSMGSIHGNEIEEKEEERREQEQQVGQTEDTARLRLMEISKAVPPTDEVDSNADEEHSQLPPQSASPSPSSSSPASRPEAEEDIRRKLMSISYSFDQPLSNPGQPVAG